MPLDNKVSVVIVNYNTKEMTDTCIESFKKYHEDLDYEIILVDNASNDGSQEFFRRKYPDIKFIGNTKNLGFGVANNIGVEEAEGEYVLLLNSDTITFKPFVQKMISSFNNNKNVGIVGLNLLNKDNTPQNSYGFFPSKGQVFFEILRLHKIKKLFPLVKPLGCEISSFNKGDFLVDYVSGACLMIKRSLWADLKGFDDNIFMYFEELDLCYRAKKFLGKNIIVNPKAQLIHLGGGSFEQYSKDKIKYFYESYLYLLDKHYSQIDRIIIIIQLIILNNVKLAFSFFNDKKRRMYGEAIKTLVGGIK